MNGKTKNEAFHQRLALLIGTEEPFRWAKRMGIPSATFARIWNNYDIPKHNHLCRIAQRCNVSLDWLLMGGNEKSSLTETFSSIPLIGFACCGVAQGWFNESELKNLLFLPSFMIEENVFAVLCRGSSMIPAGIEDGDICVVYPDRSLEPGKPALIRTKTFVKGREVSLATIKIFDSEDKDSVSLSGWLDPDETGYQSLFMEKRLKNAITFMAPVGNILPVKMSENGSASIQDVDEMLLTECLETLHPLYKQTESSAFAKAILFLYEKMKSKGCIDAGSLHSLVNMIGSKRENS